MSLKKYLPDMTAVKEYVTQAVFGRGNFINILSGQNLDDMKNPGVYICATLAIADTLANCPYKGGNFRLEVRVGTEDDRLVQTLWGFGLLATDDIRCYSRYLASNSNWSDWEPILKPVSNSSEFRGIQGTLPFTFIADTGDNAHIDLNDAKFHAPGHYGWYNVNTVANFPEGVTWTGTGGSAYLEVLKISTVNIRIQKLTRRTTHQIFLRTSTSSTEWGVWTELARRDQTRLDVFGRGNYTALVTGDDLNNVKTAGVYICNSASVTITLLNCPITDSSFRLEIKMGFADDRLLQTLTSYSPTTGALRTYHRYLCGGLWSGWEVILKAISPTANFVGIQGTMPYTYLGNNKTVDLNDPDYRIPGCYSWDSGYVPVNFPPGTWANSNIAYLEVLKVSSTNYRIQRLTKSTTNELWVRTNTSPTAYGPWERIPTSDQVIEDVYGRGNHTEIPEGANLNNYTIPGVYICASGTLAATLTNCPAAISNFRLEVKDGAARSGNSLYLAQIIYFNSTSNVARIYRRFRNAGTWSAWLPILNAIFPSLTNTTAGMQGAYPYTFLGASIETLDLNDFVDAGYYSYGVITESAINFPEPPLTTLNWVGTGYGAHFEVYKLSSGTRTMRLQRRNSNAIFTRQYLSDGWKEWKRIALTEQIIPETYGVGAFAIENGTDLNTLTEPGSYVCSGAGASATLINNPLPVVGFRLEVRHSLSATYFTQIIFGSGTASGAGNIDSVPRIWFRERSNTWWTSWKPVLFPVVNASSGVGMQGGLPYSYLGDMASIDLNHADYRVAGFHSWGAVAATVNFPPGTWTGLTNASYLEVLKIGPVNYRIQRLTKSVSNETWVRTATSTTAYGAWSKLATKDDVFGRGDFTVIPEGANLNNYTNPGVYISESEAISTSLLNAPYSAGGFRLEIKQATATNGSNIYINQIVYGNHAGDLTMFRRVRYGTAWSAWKTFMFPIFSTSDFVGMQGTMPHTYLGSATSVDLNDGPYRNPGFYSWNSLTTPINFPPGTWTGTELGCLEVWKLSASNHRIQRLIKASLNETWIRTSTASATYGLWERYAMENPYSLWRAGENSLSFTEFNAPLLNAANVPYEVFNYDPVRIGFNVSGKYFYIMKATTAGGGFHLFRLMGKYIKEITLSNAYSGSTTRAGAFSPDGKYLCQATFSGLLVVWEFSDTEFATITYRSGLSLTTTGTAFQTSAGAAQSIYATAFAPPAGLPSGIRGVLFALGTAAPFLHVRVFTGDNAATNLTTVTAPAGGGAVTGTVGGLVVSPNGKWLAVAHATAPFLTLYRLSWSGTTLTLTKLADLASGVRPAGIGGGCDFSPDGSLLAVGHTTAPFLTRYSVDSTKDDITAFTKLADLPTNSRPAGNVYKVRFSPNGKHLGAIGATSPFLTTYSLTGTGAATIMNKSHPLPTNLIPSAAGIDLSFHPDNLLAITDAKQVKLYSFYDSMYDSIANSYEMRRIRGNNSDYALALGENAMADKGGIAIGFSSSEGNGSIGIGFDTIAGEGSVALGMNSYAPGKNSAALGPGATVLRTETGITQFGANMSAIRGPVQYSVGSDERDKTDIENISQGLEFINKIQPITYVRNSRTSYIEEIDERTISEAIQEAEETIRNIYHPPSEAIIPEIITPDSEDDPNESEDEIIDAEIIDPSEESGEGSDGTLPEIELTEDQKLAISDAEKIIADNQAILKKLELRKRYGLSDYDREEHLTGTQKGERRRVGVKAQQVQAVMSEIYGSDNYADLVNDNLFGYPNLPEGVESQLTVNYSSFVPFLIQAVQELTKRVQYLENELAKK